MNIWALSWRLIKHHPLIYAGFTTCWLIFLVGRLVPGLLEQAIFNHLASSHPAGLNVWTLIALMVSFELARLTAYVGTAFYEVTVQYSSNALIQRNLLAAVLRRPGAAALSDSPEQTLNRFRDDAQDAALFITEPITLLGIFLFSVIAVAYMAQISVSLTLIVVAPLLLVVSLAMIAQSQIHRYRLASRSQTARLTAFLGSIFRAAETIKNAGAEQHALREIRAINDTRRAASVRDATFAQILDSVFYNSVDLGVGLILLLAARAILSRQFTVGDFALFDYYLFFVTRLPVTVGAFIITSRQAAVAVQRLADVAGSDDAGALGSVQPPPRVDTKDRGPLRELRAYGLTCTYPGGGRGIENVDVTILAGTLTVIAGRVGAGKTTLLRCLLGLLPVQSGSIHWNGQKLAQPDITMRPPRVAYVPQVPHLFSDTIRENITLGARMNDEVLTQAVISAALDRDVRDMPAGLDTQVGPRGVKLSGGQVQRTAIARALVRTPELLVIDDLASAVDHATERALADLLFSGGSRTYLVASNRKTVIDRASRVILLDQGKVHGCGTAAELVARDPRLQDFWL
jgi:ATP-binding cassette, subfamily B, bacterial